MSQGISWSEIHNHGLSDRSLDSSGNFTQVVVDLPSFGGIEFDITRQVVGLFVVAAIAIFGGLFLVAQHRAHRYKNPNRWVVVGEALVHLFRDRIARDLIGPKGDRYYPYLATLFIVLVLGNLIAQIPLGSGSEYVAGPTTSFAFTTVLSLISALIALFVGMKSHGVIGYWFSFVPQAVPAGVKPLVWLFELISLFVRNVALTIRIFANICGGHIVLFVVLSMIMMFAGEASPLISQIGLPPMILAVGLALSFLELLVAFLQAYIFVLLTAIFIGLSGQKH